MPRERELSAPEGKVAKAEVHTLGKYRVIAELARGGMGVVHLALMRRPGASTMLLVLKELKPELLEEPAVLTMFMQEARLAACLRHPNVVQTYEAGSDGDRRYIAMEYLDGQPLNRVVLRARKSGKTVPLELQGAVLCAALEGLAYAHAAADRDGRPMGIVHRDMSPHNIFLGYDGQVKVLDFGIAKAINSLVHTRSGVLKGKVPYMSPEQAAGAQVDARTDVFAVGVMLSEAATGRRFWSGVGNDVQILHAMSQGNLSAAHEGAMDVDEELRAVITKATAVDPSKRHAGATELLADLRAVLERRPAQPWKQQEIGRFVQELFTEDRARLQSTIREALRFQTQTISGQYLVSELRPWPTATETHDDSAPPSSAQPKPPTTSQVRPKVPRVPAPTREAMREELLLSGAEIGRAVGRLQESERMAALPDSVATIVRAVRTVGGHDVATTLEAFSDCMDVVQNFDRWRVCVSDYLLRSTEPAEHVTEVIDREPVPVLLADTSTPMRDSTLAAQSANAVALGASDVIAAAVDVDPTGRPGTGSGGRVVAMALLGAAAMLGAVVWFLGVHRPPTRPSAPSVPSVPSVLAVPALPTAESIGAVADRAAPEKVHVIVRALPAATRIVIDGTLVFENPCVVALPKDGKSHAVHVEAEGYVARDDTFDADVDRTFVWALEPRIEPRKIPGRGSGAPRGSVPPVVPPPPQAPGNAAAALGAGDKCYLSRPDKPHAAMTDATDTHAPNHGAPVPNARDENP